MRRAPMRRSSSTAASRAAAAARAQRRAIADGEVCVVAVVHAVCSHGRSSYHLDRLRGRHCINGIRLPPTLRPANDSGSCRIHYGDSVWRRRSQRSTAGWRTGSCRPSRRSSWTPAASLAERYAGVRERGGDEPVGPETLFALASLTKPLVAAACMVALEEGLLDLDAEVRDGFTLRHLLSHCAGLPEAGLRWQEPPEYRPGTQRWYSNAGYVQAARLLEAASGHAVRRRICTRPCSLRSAWTPRSVWPRPTRRAPRASGSRGATATDELFNSERFRRDAPPQGGGFASARAYGRLLSCLLAGGAAGGGGAARGGDGRGDAGAAVRPAAGRRQRRGRVARPLLGPRLRRARPARAALVGHDARARARRATSAPRARSPGSIPSAGSASSRSPTAGAYTGWWREPWAALGAAVTAAAAAA